MLCALAPPALVQRPRGFLADHPFDGNVFGMARFPEARAGTADPVGRALAVAREVCNERGLEFHLASDRAIVDTDFVGMIYQSIDLSDEGVVRVLVTTWLNDDLRIGKI